MTTVPQTGLLRPDLEGYNAASNLEFNNKIKALQKQGHNIYHFGFGQSPFPIPECFVDGLRRHANQHEYMPVSGIPELRHQILDFHKEYDGFSHFHSDAMVVGAGSKEVLYLILNVFGGDILLVSPSWTTYNPQCHLAGKQVYLVPTYFEDRFIPRPDIIEKVVTENCSKNSYKLMVLNSPSNPTGIALRDKELTELTEVCRKHHILVVSDEIYARLQYDGIHQSMANYYPEGTIVTSGFSKWASAGGWRMGYGLFPQGLMPIYKAVASGGSHTYTCAPAPMQYAIVDGMEHKDDLRAYVTHSRKILEAVSNHTYRELSKVGIQAHLSEGGYYFMPDFGILRNGFEKAGIMNGQDMCDAMLEEADVALMPCDPHYLRPPGELTTRYCYINFDGGPALEASYKLGPDAKLEDQFVHKYCTPTVDGLQSLIKWMKRYESTNN